VLRWDRPDPRLSAPYRAQSMDHRRVITDAPERGEQPLPPPLPRRRPARSREHRETASSRPHSLWTAGRAPRSAPSTPYARTTTRGLHFGLYVSIRTYIHVLSLMIHS
jgi:hypothetical protein